MFYLLQFLLMHAHVREIKERVEVVRGMRGKSEVFIVLCYQAFAMLGALAWQAKST